MSAVHSSHASFLGGGQRSAPRRAVHFGAVGADLELGIVGDAVYRTPHHCDGSGATAAQPPEAPAQGHGNGCRHARHPSRCRPSFHSVEWHLRVPPPPLVPVARRAAVKASRRPPSRRRLAVAVAPPALPAAVALAATRLRVATRLLLLLTLLPVLVAIVTRLALTARLTLLHGVRHLVSFLRRARAGLPGHVSEPGISAAGAECVPRSAGLTQRNGDGLLPLANLASRARAERAPLGRTGARSACALLTGSRPVVPSARS
jgi:hypothetical protein